MMARVTPARDSHDPSRCRPCGQAKTLVDHVVSSPGDSSRAVIDVGSRAGGASSAEIGFAADEQVAARSMATVPARTNGCRERMTIERDMARAGRRRIGVGSPSWRGRGLLRRIRGPARASCRPGQSLPYRSIPDATSGFLRNPPTGTPYVPRDRASARGRESRRRGARSSGSQRESFVSLTAIAVSPSAALARPPVLPVHDLFHPVGGDPADAAPCPAGELSRSPRPPSMPPPPRRTAPRFVSGRNRRRRRAGRRARRPGRPPAIPAAAEQTAEDVAEPAAAAAARQAAEDVIDAHIAAAAAAVAVRSPACWIGTFLRPGLALLEHLGEVGALAGVSFAPAPAGWHAASGPARRSGRPAGSSMPPRSRRSPR